MKFRLRLSSLGKTAELVRIAHAESGEQKAVFGVVRNLAVSRRAVVVLMVAYLRQSRQERLPDCPSQDLAVHTLFDPATKTSEALLRGSACFASLFD